jgi:hypothetical protein
MTQIKKNIGSELGILVWKSKIREKIFDKLYVL